MSSGDATTGAGAHEWRRPAISARALALAVTALLLVALHQAPANASTRVVHPTGLYPIDVATVTVAAASGGTVVLKSQNVLGVPTAFNFGPSDLGGGRVLITRSVEIRGESEGGHMATIRGGHPPLQTIAGVGRVAVRYIHFDRPGGQAFVLEGAHGGEFSHNKVTGLVPALNAVGVTEGIAVFGFEYSGTFVITDNVIDGFAPGDYASGVVLIDGDAAHIARNDIEGTPTLGISVIAPRGSVEVDGNRVDSSSGGASDNGGTGIGVYGPAHGVAVRITDNDVVTQNPEADGILLSGTAADPVAEAVIARNAVTMHGSNSGAISLYGSVNDSQAIDNRIAGSGAVALLASPVSDSSSQTANAFIDNDLTGFESSHADVFLDLNTRQTVVSGVCRTVIDLGMDNQVDCGQEG